MEGFECVWVSEFSARILVWNFGIYLYFLQHLDLIISQRGGSGRGRHQGGGREWKRGGRSELTLGGHTPGRSAPELVTDPVSFVPHLQSGNSKPTYRRTLYKVSMPNNRSLRV